MSRYIKGEDMRAIFCQSNSLTQAWNGFDMLPSIDIVRCAECKYFIDNLTEDDTDEAYDSCRWDWSRKIPTADDFCSYGERKESE